MTRAKMTTFRGTAVIGLAACSMAAAQPLAVFEARERLGLDWPRTLVTYELSGFGVQGSGVPSDQTDRSDLSIPDRIPLAAPAKPGEMHLVDTATGAEVPFQLSAVRLGRKPLLRPAPLAAARISFYAELPADGSYRYELHPGKPSPNPEPRTLNPPIAASNGNGLTLDNGLVAIRLPPVGERVFDPPVPFETDDIAALGRLGSAPGPVFGLRLADGSWVGGSYFRAVDGAALPRIVRVDCRVIEQGPLFVEARVRYDFDSGAWYALTVRLLAGDAAVRLDEQADWGTNGDPASAQVVFVLANPAADRQWSPDRAFWHTGEGRLAGRDEPFEARLAALGFGVGPLKARDMGSRKLPFGAEAGQVFDVAVWYPWHPNAFYFGLLRATDLTTGADLGRIPFQAVVPLHAGNWRGAVDAFNGTLHTQADGAVALHWPLLASPHPNTLLHTGEYDPERPLSFVRRQWAWVGGPPQYHDTLYPLRGYEGYVNLDAYKDWLLDWPGSTATAHPCLGVNREALEAIRSRLDTHPAGAVLRDQLFFEDSPARRAKLVAGLLRDCQWTAPHGVVRHGLRESWRSHFLWAVRAGWAIQADELFSSPELDPQARRAVQAQIAAFCHLMAEPDFNPRGSMAHLGNPNMPINRFMGLAFAAATIPEHPLAPVWLKVAGQYVGYKLAMNAAPGGAWSELVSYYYASAPMLANGALMAAGAGRLDPAIREVAAQVVEFTLKLMTPPDPRFGGRRIVPGFGHEGLLGNTGQNDGGAHVLTAAALLRDHAPERAAALAWAWNQMGRPAGNSFDTGFADRTLLHADLGEQATPEIVRQALASAWLPGFGAVLRSHAGEADETYLAYRQGYLASHSDENQGDFVLYARGVPLTVMSLHGYPLHQHPDYIELHKNFGWHSRVRFGEQANTGGWPGGGLISQVHAHAFGDSVDYLRGVGDYGPQRWTRQIALLKGRRPGDPETIVFRDSFVPLDGNPASLERKWWYQRTLGTAEQISPREDGFDYASAFGPRLLVRFPRLSQVQIESRHANRPITLAKQPVDDPLTVTAVGPIEPGRDLLVCLVPLAADEAPPQLESPAEGVVKVTTREGTDYVFLAPGGPFACRDGEVAFAGLAGAVRVFADEVHLVLAEGPGEVSFGGLTLRGAGPATRVFRRDAATPQVVELPPLEHDIDFRVDAATAVRQLGPGVTRHDTANGFAVVFEAEAPFVYESDGVRFRGRRGGFAVDRQAGTTRLTVVEGEEIGYGDLRAWGAAGPWEVVFSADRLAGRCAGLGRFLYVTRPAGLDRLPVYVLDGLPYAPGSADNTLILPLPAGAHSYELRALEQPPVFRSPPAWEGGLGTLSRQWSETKTPTGLQ